MDQIDDTCVEKIIPLVDNLCENLNSAELEARFGKIVDGKFIPGVTRQFMDYVLDMMQKSPYVTGNDEWTEELDVYYKDEKNNQLRTRVNYDSELFTISTITVNKTSLNYPIDLLYTPKDTKTTSFDMRISLKNEEIVTTPPCSVNSDLVRIKQRRRFICENLNWAFDFSMSWSGRTRSEAEERQMNEEPKYEIECELINNQYAVTKTHKHIAASLLLKMIDLLPTGKLHTSSTSKS